MATRKEIAHRAALKRLTAIDDRLRPIQRKRNEAYKAERTAFYALHPVYDLDCAIDQYKRNGGGHFFSTDTMSYFNCKLYDFDWKTRRFITSEKDSFHWSTDPRAYTVRAFSPCFTEIEKVSEFQEFNTLRAARRAMAAD